MAEPAAGPPAQMKRSTYGVHFGNEFVPAGTVLPVDHPYTDHEAFVEYRPPAMDAMTPSPPAVKEN